MIINPRKFLTISDLNKFSNIENSAIRNCWKNLSVPMRKEERISEHKPGVYVTKWVLHVHDFIQWCRDNFTRHSGNKVILATLKAFALDQKGLNAL